MEKFVGQPAPSHQLNPSLDMMGEVGVADGHLSSADSSSVSSTMPGAIVTPRLSPTEPQQTNELTARIVAYLGPYLFWGAIGVLSVGFILLS